MTTQPPPNAITCHDHIPASFAYARIIQHGKGRKSLCQLPHFWPYQLGRIDSHIAQHQPKPVETRALWRLAQSTPAINLVGTTFAYYNAIIIILV